MAEVIESFDELKGKVLRPIKECTFENGIAFKIHAFTDPEWKTYYTFDDNAKGYDDRDDWVVATSLHWKTSPTPTEVHEKIHVEWSLDDWSDLVNAIMRFNHEQLRMTNDERLKLLHAVWEHEVEDTEAYFTFRRSDD